MSWKEATMLSAWQILTVLHAQLQAGSRSKPKDAKVSPSLPCYTHKITPFQKTEDFLPAFQHIATFRP